MPSYYVQDPFISTSLQTQLGGGVAMDLQTPFTDLDGNEVYVLEGDLFFASLGLAYQQKLGEKIGVGIKMNALVRSGTNAESFLTKGAGMYSGHMLSQYTADMLIVEQKILSTPASIQSIPAAADQEDFVSMGMNAALKARQIMENAHGILGIEFIAATQGLDFRDHEPGAGVRAAHGAVREVVEHLDVDRPLFTDHNNMFGFHGFTAIPRPDAPRGFGGDIRTGRFHIGGLRSPSGVDSPC